MKPSKHSPLANCACQAFDPSPQGILRIFFLQMLLHNIHTPCINPSYPSDKSTSFYSAKIQLYYLWELGYFFAASSIAFLNNKSISPLFWYSANSSQPFSSYGNRPKNLYFINSFTPKLLNIRKFIKIRVPKNNPHIFLLFNKIRFHF